jgi:hypothetical protein
MQETTTASPGMPPMAPVRYDVEYQEMHSRLLIFVKWLLAIPHLIILYALYFVQYVITIIAFFTILFTQSYPQGLFNFSVGVLRWQANVNAYLWLLRDEYPPFTWDEDKYPVTLQIDYPEKLARFAPLYKWLLIIPNIIVLAIVGLVAFLLIFVGWFAILFTGKLPKGIHDFVVGTMRWSTRATAYMYLMRDEYPPFSMK